MVDLQGPSRVTELPVQKVPPASGAANLGTNRVSAESKKLTTPGAKVGKDSRVAVSSPSGGGSSRSKRGPNDVVSKSSVSQNQESDMPE